MCVQWCVCVHEDVDDNIYSLHTCCTFHSSVIMRDIRDTSDIALSDAWHKRKEGKGLSSGKLQT
jgi:hypothetical protein